MSRYLHKVPDGLDAWNEWESLLGAESPDLLAILRVGAQLQAYLAAVEREALKAARGAGLTWAQLGEALGTTRQAVWQRATTWNETGPPSGKPRTGAHPLIDEDVLARLRELQSDGAARRDRIAGEMFDGATDVLKLRRPRPRG